MNTRRCLRIAERMHVLLLDSLGEGVDPQRMVEDSLYARDVLLVCDAHVGSDLASLAQHYRAALAEAPDRDYRSRPGNFDELDADTPPRPRPWFHPERWFGP